LITLPKDLEHIWLDAEIQDPKVLLPILAPYPAEAMDFKWGLGPVFA
jgi:hypothetical protein